MNLFFEPEAKTFQSECSKNKFIYLLWIINLYIYGLHDSSGKVM